MHVVCVGAWPDAFDALLASGHAVTVLYENNEQNRQRIAPYREQLAHVCAVDSYLQVESLLSAVRHTIAVDEGVDVVVSLFEAAVFSAAVLGSLLGASALDPHCALRCRDKALQKQAWQRAGVPTARHVVSADASSRLAPLVEQAELSPPFVLKPIAGRGAMDTSVVVSADALEERASSIRANRPDLECLLVEERSSGDEWIVDGAVAGGRIRWLLLSKYCSPVIECTLHNPLRLMSFPPARHPEWYAAATEFAARAVSALGLRNSAFHLEAFGTPERLVAGELAARPAGGLLPSLATRLLGVDPWESTVRCMTGERVPTPGHGAGRVLAYVAVPVNPGEVNHLHASDFTAVPGVVEVDMDIPPETRMPAQVSSPSIRVGTVVVEGDDEEQCSAGLERVLAVVWKTNGEPGCARARPQGEVNGILRAV